MTAPLPRPGRLRLARALIALIVLGSTLAACAKKPAFRGCPSVAVIDRLDRQELRGGALVVTLTPLEAICEFDGEQFRVRARLELFAFATDPQKPRPTGKIEVAYLVTTLGPDGSVADQSRYRTTIDLDQELGSIEEIEQELVGVGVGQAPGWQVLFGLEPDEEGRARLRSGAR